MALKLPGSPALPNIPYRDQQAALRLWAGALTQALFRTLTDIAFRSNNSLPADGTERMTAPLPLQEVLTAARPTPTTDLRGTMFWVTDAPAGDEMQVCNGTGWYPVTFGPVIP